METAVTFNGKRIALMEGTPEEAERKINVVLRKMLNISLAVAVGLAVYIVAHLR
jgi:hypothetical protein